MASDGDDDHCKLRVKLASGGTQYNSAIYLFPLSPRCEESDHALWNASAFSNNCGIVDKLIGSKLENEERADKRRDVVCDNLAVDHVACKL